MSEVGDIFLPLEQKTKYADLMMYDSKIHLHNPTIHLDIFYDLVVVHVLDTSSEKYHHYQ